MSRPREQGLARQVLADPVHWLPFGLGAGLLPRAPGTWASALTVLLVAAWPALQGPVGLAACGLLFAIGIPLCGASERRLGVHDHGGIVLDEIVAMLAVLQVTPRSVPWFIAAFALFRLFDIWKPWPIREIDHSVPGGAGTMLDDAMAAIYAAVLVKGSGLLFFPGQT
jgi:phosphatidylglycerophosphatase A